MIVGITGTPGIGKTSVCKVIGMEFIELNKVIEENRFYFGIDEERECYIADIGKLETYLRSYCEERRKSKSKKKEKEETLLIEGHLAHYLKPDIAIVLRANPLLLCERLKKKGFGEKKIKENMQAEALDVILMEAVEMCKVVYEVDTSNKSIKEVVDCVKQIISWGKGDKDKEEKEERKEKYKPGVVDWTYLIEEVFNDP